MGKQVVSFTESHNHRGWKGPLKIPSATPSKEVPYGSPLDSCPLDIDEHR